MKLLIPTEVLRMRQAYSLDEKIQLSIEKIREWHNVHCGRVYVSFSGGLDSTVLRHLVHSIYPDTPAIFADTGLEYPEIRRHVKRTPNVVIIRPSMPFQEVITRYGYPVISKRIAQYVHEVQTAKGDTATRRLRLTGITSGGKHSKFSKIPLKWQYLIVAPFKVSDHCCEVMKKRPFKLAELQFGYPFIGTRAEEGQQRELTYLQYGCNAYDIKRPRSTPLAFWLDSDIREYIRAFNVPYSEIYDMGYSRTGCMFCMFGVHLSPEPNRFQLMRLTHPKQHEYCMDKLGLARVLDYIKVPYREVLQPRLF